MLGSRILARLLQLPPVLFGVSLIVFLMITLTPGDPIEIMLADQRATPEQYDALRRDFGLDRPLPERFFLFLANALRFEFGISFFHRRAVADVILERLPATLELTFAAILIAVLIAVPLGIAAAVRRGSWLDRVCTAGGLFGVSMPGFWFGLIGILIFAVNLKLLPVGGRVSLDFETPRITGFLLFDTLAAGHIDAFANALKHLLMPALTLGLPSAAILMRVVRASMVEALRSDYVLFAESKGLSRTRVIGLHALKNALAPAVTVAAIETGALLGGNMIVETVFGWPGLGRLVVEAIFARNYPLIQAAVLLYATTYVCLNFMADVAQTLLNPKVKL